MQNKLTEKLEEYVALLEEELSDYVIKSFRDNRPAYTHRAVHGEKLRTEIAELKNEKAKRKASKV